MTVYLSIAGQSDVGRVRPHNEDALLVADIGSGLMLRGDAPRARLDVGTKGVLLAVSDGMGGEKAGEVASAVVVEAMARAMMEANNGQRPVSLVEGAVQQANREVLRAAEHQGHPGMGATLTALYVQPESTSATAFIAEVGDSRAYLLRQGQLAPLTKDQSYVQLLLDSGTLDAQEAASSPLRNVILQAMGRPGSIDVAMGRITLRQRDCLLVCSDGLTHAVEDDEIRDVILHASDLPEACRRLVGLANERGGDDNVTVLTAGVGGDLPAPSPAGEAGLEILSSFEPRLS
jgi:serine/threonine protein phosphatase PrpC